MAIEHKVLKPTLKAAIFNNDVTGYVGFPVQKVKGNCYIAFLYVIIFIMVTPNCIPSITPWGICTMWEVQ